MLIPLAAAIAATCGGKAAGLAALVRAGFPVPDGVVIPFDGHDSGELARWLDGAGDPVVAVRSSASTEDTAHASAAGQHDSFLAVQGIDAVEDAVRACRWSLWSARAAAYRDGDEPPSMAVIVQRHVDADSAGVLFTPTGSSAPTLIEAAWGLGPSVVEGRVLPDRYEVLGAAVSRVIADKPTALERVGANLVVRPVGEERRRTPSLSDATAVRLAELGGRAAALFGCPQDVEWAVVADTVWLLQSRPITAEPPAPAQPPTVEQVPTTEQVPTAGALTGIAAGRGTATGPARIVRGPADFGSVRPGDVLVCPYTDPAWTPLLAVAAGVVTETGGILSHAAIVARERNIPAVVSVPQATTRIPPGATVTLDGATGAVHVERV